MFSTRLFSIPIYKISLSASTITHTHLLQNQIASFPCTFLHHNLTLIFTSFNFQKMVKFSKELEAQLIPEWKEAFVNYWQLKKQIKKIKLSKLPKQPQHIEGDFGLSIFDSLGHFFKKFAINEENITNIIKVRKSNNS